MCFIKKIWFPFCQVIYQFYRFFFSISIFNIRSIESEALYLFFLKKSFYLFSILQQHQMKLNRTKYTFTIKGKIFLGFMVRSKGIKPNLKKIQEIWLLLRQWKMYID